MIEPRFRWQFPVAITIDEALAAAGSRHGLDSRVVAILARRGLLNGAAFDGFFAPALEALHDPRLLQDADRFAARITRARSRG